MQVPVLFFSVIVHEFAHGFTAYRKGDDTAYLSGRLTLNPLPHIDLVGTVIIPIVCLMSSFPVIGWAKPVPVNPYRMGSPRRDMALVALSGPVSNITLAAIAVLLFKAASLSNTEVFLTLQGVFGFAVMINLMLAVFNLIPIYPLDGSNIMLGWLSGRWLENYEKHMPYGMYIILGLVLTGLMRYIVAPPLAAARWLLAVMGI